MSNLRDQLHALRDDYRGEKYPGDLAAEILAPQPRRLPVGKFASAATLITALAAAVVLFVSLEPAVVAPTSPVRGVATTQEVDANVTLADASVPVNELGPMPSFPDEVPLVPDALPLVPEGVSITDLGAMPELPPVDLGDSLDT